MKVIALTALTFGRGTVYPGETVELDDVSAAALIKEGAAEAAEAEGADGAGISADLPPDEEVTKNADADLELTRAALDAKYNREEGGAKPGLSEAAKALGVEFPYDAPKSAIIEAVIEQGAAAALLQ